MRISLTATLRPEGTSSAAAARTTGTTRDGHCMQDRLTMRHDRAVNTRKGTRALLLAAALLALGACTGQFVYNRLDFIIPFYVGQRVTLDEPQEVQLKLVVREFTSWHRSSQLTRYSAFLRELARDSEQPTTRAQIEAASRSMETFWFDMVREALPEGSQWLRSLSREQV